ncbi:MAG: FAD-dependent oxidoreductase [Planctomycetota bacterium]|nr:FAD-dependent oxidoreductase [Planctomycetota bacterium]
MVDKPCHAVAVIGGATAGSTVAEILAAAGCQVVVFEQNERPYGKIEDGLPRWHDKQREMEYRKIDERLRRPGVTFVPRTKLGQDLDFLELARDWGWSAVVLANGAWKDRPLDAAGAGDVVDRGLVYQNPFVYWFNHYHEVGYAGPRYEVPDEAVVVGGGLASIDVIKIIQLELYARALRARGVTPDVIAMEHEGIPKYCQAHGIDDPSALGVKGGVLLYRRRIDDMPLSPMPKGANEKQIAKAGEVRHKILSKCQSNFLFQVRPQTLTRELVIEDGRLRGLVVCKSEVQGRDAAPVPGTEETLRTDLVVSSIGSIPEPLTGVEMKGVYYAFKDWDTGEYGPLPGVFASGNVVTGQGNIKASLDHGKQVAQHLIERYLDCGPASAAAATTAAAVTEHLARKGPLPAEKVDALLERARARQREVGYDDYASWIQKVTPQV